MERKIGARFSLHEYIMVDMDAMKIIETNGGGTTEYSIGGTSIEKKLLYTNPDTTVEMSTDTMFTQEDIDGYDFIEFIVTDTSGTHTVKELCEIAPLSFVGQFVISLPGDNALWVRKIYRSGGNVKPSAKVNKIGEITEDRTKCIVKEAYAIKVGE